MFGCDSIHRSTTFSSYVVFIVDFISLFFHVSFWYNRCTQCIKHSGFFFYTMCLFLYLLCTALQWHFNFQPWLQTDWQCSSHTTALSFQRRSPLSFQLTFYLLSLLTSNWHSKLFLVSGLYLFTATLAHSHNFHHW